MGMMETAFATATTGNSGAAAAQVKNKECLTLKLGAEEYGIDILKVKEIRSYDNPTRIANAPEFIKGVINLRGDIVPIVDLRMKFNLAETSYNELTVVIILNVANRVIGAVVDSVSDVVELAPDQIRPAPEFNDTVEASFITGLASIHQGDQERMLILIDIERLMASHDMGLVEQKLQ